MSVAGDPRYHHDRARSRFELLDGDAVISLADYRRVGDSYAIVHTETRPELGGRGMAGRLVRAALADIRAEGATVLPMCSFVAAYLRHHPEEADLVPAGRREDFGLPG